MARKVLVSGATGVVGASVTAKFAAAGWETHGASRNLPVQPIPGVKYHAADLLDPASCAKLAEAVGPLDELGYCAINEAPGSLVEKWTDKTQVKRNGAMYANLLDAVLPRSPQFKHCSIVHGTKAYALHFRDRKPPIPLEERAPRVPHDNFYFEQEDEAARRAQGANWTWTVFRAPVILGGGVGTNLSNFLAFGVLAAIAKAQGKGLDFPGVPEGGGIFDVIDSDLLGDVFVWAADAKTARNQIFNVANGAVAQWRSLWPIIADANGVTVGADTPGASLVEASQRIQPIWADLVKKYDLVAPADLKAFLGESFALADFTLASRTIGIMSLIKLRQAGFDKCLDNPTQIRAWYDRWRAARLLPPL
jgi:nucleoside-diphosphate-sugar epimerase